MSSRRLRVALIFTCLTNVIDRSTCRRHLGIKQQEALTITLHDLRLHLLAFRRHHDIVAPFRNLHFSHRTSHESLVVIHYQRHALHLHVHTRGYCRHAMCEDIGKLLQCKQLIVPRELIGTWDRRAGDIIVELMPDEALPGIGEQGTGVGSATQPFCHHGGAFGSIAQMFVLPVVELHRSLRRIAAIAMHVHWQFTIEDRQFRMLVERHEILVYLVARGTDDLYRPIAVDALLHRPHRLQVGRTTNITGAIIPICHIEWTFLDFPYQILVIRQVGIFPSLRIVESVRHHDATAIDALPQTNGERIALATLIERLCAPHELLRRETDEAAMRCQRGQGIAKAKAVGQEDVCPLGIELRAIERLSEKHVPKP